ncbi:MAG: hypothetical protein COW00_18655 [Bdellovibrio sp. CG12_big_fil_rev_8_21_14_0_65_39_13]|nr:MAG: hypothetical protein COW78_15090 [Bdellovibrio sp. CG22_combo_CG10-13_8_21_14_all_39_27]PIQ57859.1 MAG: hypothetical protein COW00_18655 [Bdellovibrio sp. CG12_big_fil_rev_8_21_14_0_65_39_13]PIR32493.1 MAG: hypothetical protein COV37_19655 [Bdellovibrio sp. CG11_big_fil_rev_8_21_14_0_20_39_38]
MKDFYLFNYILIFSHIWLLTVIRDYILKHEKNKGVFFITSLVCLVSMILSLTYLKDFFPSIKNIMTIKVTELTFPIFIAMVIFVGAINQAIIKKRGKEHFYSFPSFQLLLVGLLFFTSLKLAQFIYSI